MRQKLRSDIILRHFYNKSSLIERAYNHDLIHAIFNSLQIPSIAQERTKQIDII